MCIKSEVKEICLSLATNGWSDKSFLLTSKVCPEGVFFPCLGLYTWIKSLKMCIKSDFEEIILKLATHGQREKAFLLSPKFCPQGVVCPCPGAIYMYKSIKIYTRTWCLVSVYRITGPLVFFFFCMFVQRKYCELCLFLWVLHGESFYFHVCNNSLFVKLNKRKTDFLLDIFSFLNQMIESYTYTAFCHYHKFCCLDTGFCVLHTHVPSTAEINDMI